MLSLRSAIIAGAILAIVATTPAHAGLSTNALISNGLTQNGLSANALTTNAFTSNAITSNALVATASAIADLNGVTVEGISVPPGAKR